MAEDSTNKPLRRTQIRVDRRDRANAKRSRRRLFYGIVGGSVGLALILGLFLPQLGQISGGRTFEAPPESSFDEVGTKLAVQESDVVAPGADHIPYLTIPASSGPRYAEPAPWGISDTQLAEEALVANLHRGGVAISHNLTNPDDLVELTEFTMGLAGYPGCLVQHVHSGVAENTITMTAWGWRQEFAELNTEAMALFYGAHLNQAPHYFSPDCGAGTE